MKTIGSQTRETLVKQTLQNSSRGDMMRKTRVLILASPNGTLTMKTAAEHRRNVTAYTRNWQVLLQFRTYILSREMLVKCRNAAYDYAIHAFGL